MKGEKDKNEIIFITKMRSTQSSIMSGYSQVKKVNFNMSKRRQSNVLVNIYADFSTVSFKKCSFQISFI